MAGIKVIFVICLTLLAMAMMSSAAKDEKPIRISEDWFMEHGCPEKGYFKMDKNGCSCYAKHSYIAACTLLPNITPVKDDFKFGTACKPGEEFFTRCQLCSCNEDGEAICDDKACGYYPKVKLDISNLQ